MHVLIVGSLQPWGERVLALEDLGYRLSFGYLHWVPEYNSLQTAGIETFPLDGRFLARQVAERVVRNQSRLIYCLLNYHDGSNGLCAALTEAHLPIPILRHYKEHLCRPSEGERIALTRTHAQVYINEESFDHFHRLYGVRRETAFFADADLIPARYLEGELSQKSSANDGEPHLLVAGEVTDNGNRYDYLEFASELARRRIHVHIYGKFFKRLVGPLQGDEASRQRTGDLEDDASVRWPYEFLARETGYIHVHELIPPTRFVPEWSRYDAGVLHQITPTNWSPFDGLNLPHRYSAYLAAGLPLLVRRGTMAAMERLIRTEGLGYTYKDYNDLADFLHDRAMLMALQARIVARRVDFTYEAVARRLRRCFEAALEF